MKYANIVISDVAKKEPKYISSILEDSEDEDLYVINLNEFNELNRLFNATKYFALENQKNKSQIVKGFIDEIEDKYDIIRVYFCQSSVDSKSLFDDIFNHLKDNEKIKSIMITGDLNLNELLGTRNGALYPAKEKFKKDLLKSFGYSKKEIDESFVINDLCHALYGRSLDLFKVLLSRENRN